MVRLLKARIAINYLTQLAVHLPLNNEIDSFRVKLVEPSVPRLVKVIIVVSHRSLPAHILQKRTLRVPEARNVYSH